MKNLPLHILKTAHCRQCTANRHVSDMLRGRLPTSLMDAIDKLQPDKEKYPIVTTRNTWRVECAHSFLSLS